MPRPKYILFHRKISWEFFREIFNQFLDHWDSITIKLFLKDCQNDPAIFRKEYMPRNTSLICNTKNPSVRAGDARDVCSIPSRRKWQSTPVFLPGKSHGQRSLVGYGPWNLKKSLTQLSMHVHTHTHTHTKHV